MRTYSGHSTAQASNALYRSNLAKGQTGLSIAFDLPTQTGHDPDHPMATGEVGKVGVPVVHKGHMATLMDGIPVGEMNTSMTINAPAAWMFGLYIANATDQATASSALRGTTQNDIVKEYLSRGTHIFPPAPSRRLIVDMFAFCHQHAPRWNPMNVCSYHLQEAGATPVQEIAYSMANAIDVLEAVRQSGQVAEEKFSQVVASMSFFVNSGIRFVEETCKVRAFTELWDRICLERFQVSDPKARRFRYGVQVNSLGLTEAQPENNVHRIILEALGVTLSRQARTRSLQLPAWNEALGLPRPWDQQWSLRAQQILAMETDLLDYDDLFAGSHVVEAKTKELVEGAQAELDRIIDLGGAFEAIGDMKAALVASHTDRLRRIEAGDQTVVGVNAFTETEPSPLGGADAIVKVDPAVQQAMIDDVRQWRASRSTAEVQRCLDELKAAASGSANIMAPTIALAAAGGTTGEWADTLRDVFGEFRAPTGVSGSGASMLSAGILQRVSDRMKAQPEGPVRILIAKPGLDGHSNGAEQIAVAARDAGMEVIYQGIRSTPDQIAAVASDEDPDAIGLSILSGSHQELVPAVVDAVRSAGVQAPIVVGGIIPPEDHTALVDKGIAAVYTPKDFELGRIIEELAELALRYRDPSAPNSD